MNPLPWPLIGRSREPEIHPIEQAARHHPGVRYVPTSPRPAQPPRPSSARTDYETTAAGWTARESAVLGLLADAGGGPDRTQDRPPGGVMTDLWSPTLQFAGAVLATGVPTGYLIGRWRPLTRARDWAWWEVRVGEAPGRIRGAAMIALLPERFAPLIWHRIHHGRYPEPPRRCPAPAPALVNRPTDEGDTDA